MTNDTLNSATGSGDTTVSPNSATLGFVQPAETPAQKPAAQDPAGRNREYADDTGHSGYLGLWARTPRELGFLLPTLPVVVVTANVAVGPPAVNGMYIGYPKEKAARRRLSRRAEARVAA